MHPNYRHDVQAQEEEYALIDNNVLNYLYSYIIIFDYSIWCQKVSLVHLIGV